MRHLFTAALAAALTATSFAQVSRLYATQGTAFSGSTFSYQGGSLVGNFNWAADAQMPIVVGDFGSGVRIRQAAGQPQSGSPQQGDEYLLDGTPTGFTNFWNSGDPAGTTAYDAAFDGSNIYMVHWLGSTNGQVWKYDNNYANGVFLFQAQSGDLGITYDSGTNSLWTGNFNNGTVKQWSMTGALLNTFAGGNGSAAALAYDQATSSLWLHSGGTFFEYDRNGTQLSSFATGRYLLGAEFVAVPEPGTIAAMALGTLLLLRRRAR